MKKSKDLALVLAAAVAICFALVSLLQSAPPDWADPGPKPQPIWDITGANWVDHTPNPRFAIYDPEGNSTADPATWVDDLVLDKETRLLWERSPITTTERDWYDAKWYCYNEKVLANRRGFRLPTMEEWTSLLDPSEFNPALPPGHPFNQGVAVKYWTSTTIAEYPNTAYNIYFPQGYMINDAKDDVTNHFAWCVRGGIGHDAY